jgi:hypothetical protein
MDVITLDHDYHVVELNHYGMTTEMHNWLQTRFGIGDGERWFYRHPKVFFFDRKDHLMFLIRWAHE